MRSSSSPPSACCSRCSSPSSTAARRAASCRRGARPGPAARRVRRAVCQWGRGAALVGINVRAFHGAMWGVGAALAAVGGVLVAPITLLHPGLGASFLIKGFAAMTLGGFGSFGGAVLGGLILGVAEQLVGGFVSTKLIDITAYLVIILVLALRPNGLFGRAIAEKV